MKFFCKSIFLFSDQLQCGHEVWVLRGLYIVQLGIIMVLLAIIIKQCKKLKGLVLVDLNRSRNVRRIRKNLRTTRL